MSKHTPGPWKHVDGIVLTHDEKFICDCASSDLDPDTQDNNASLIAAAPELFEAAKRLVSFIDSQKPLRPLQDQYNRTLTKRADWVNKLLAGKYIAARGANLMQEGMNDQSFECAFPGLGILRDAIKKAEGKRGTNE